MSTQKGPVPEKIKGVNYPLDQREAQNQAETRQEKAFPIVSEKMPTIDFTHQRTKGVEGTIPASSGSPLRQGVQDSRPADPESNVHAQFVKPDQITRDERLR